MPPATNVFSTDEFKHPTDGWYQIEALGDHLNRAVELVQVVDGAAVSSIVNRFNADADAGELRHGNSMLIDHEHFSALSDQESIAYGWLLRLQARPDGIYGKIRWTDVGQSAVDGGEYRFFSTEYARSDLTPLDDGKPQRVRPLALCGLTLTNMPNNRGQKPITNRATMTAPNAKASSAPAPVSVRLLDGSTVFKTMLAVVRNRTGFDHSRAFNSLLAENKDLLGKQLCGTNHTNPLLRLLNRTSAATGLSRSVCTELCAKKTTALVNRFMPALNTAPTALQWDILSRTAAQLEKCGVARAIYNRAAAEPSPADWKAANARSAEVLNYLKDVEAKSGDWGCSDSFQKKDPRSKWRCFKAQVDRLMTDEKLSVDEAFSRLKETHPIFWTESLLSFEPEK